MKQVVMEAIIKVIKPLNHKSFDIGGFNFTIEGKKIPFDFNATGYNIELKENESIITYVSGEGPFFKEYDIDTDTYEKEYNEFGLTSNDITAEFLSNVEKIGEIYIEPVDYIGEFVSEIKTILFFDEMNREYKVKQEVIDEYNTHNSLYIGEIEEDAKEDMNSSKDVFSILNSNAYIRNGIRKFNNSKYRIKIHDLDTLIYNIDNLSNIAGIGKTTMNRIYQILKDNGYNINNKNKDIEIFGKIMNNDNMYNLICRYNLYLKNSIQKEIVLFDDLYSLILNNELLDIISNNIDIKIRNMDIAIYNEICNILIENEYRIK